MGSLTRYRLKRVIDVTALNHIHVGAFDFRLPYLPAPGSWPDNTQTVEGGLFIWDGGDTGKGYGLAFQWVLNPWMSTFGDIWCRIQTNGGSWGPSTHLVPDQAWHRAEFVLDIQNAAASMSIDGVGVPAAFGAEDKLGWGTETAARFRAELVSLWPGNNPMAPSHRAEFRNWTWDWSATRRPDQTRIMASAAAINQRWRERTGRALIGVVLG